MESLSFLAGRNSGERAAGAAESLCCEPQEEEPKRLLLSGCLGCAWGVHSAPDFGGMPNGCGEGSGGEEREPKLRAGGGGSV